MSLQALAHRLDELLDLLREIGVDQLASRDGVRVHVKGDGDPATAWRRNDVVSETDLRTEARLVAFFRESGFRSILAEESHLRPVADDGEPLVVIDPLDGTRVYLSGDDRFGISIGVLQRGRFRFAVNFYPGDAAALYAFEQDDCVRDASHRPVAQAVETATGCYLSEGFLDLLCPEYRDVASLERRTGLTVLDRPRSATFNFRAMIAGQLGAYLSEDIPVWDFGPSSLLLEKSGFALSPLSGGQAIDAAALLCPPFRLPRLAVAARSRMPALERALEAMLPRAA
ncbi:MAG: inositol monophosphatase family protein [Thermoanaerobaculia bacterium]